MYTYKIDVNFTKLCWHSVFYKVQYRQERRKKRWWRLLHQFRSPDKPIPILINGGYTDVYISYVGIYWSINFSKVILIIDIWRDDLKINYNHVNYLTNNIMSLQLAMPYFGESSSFTETADITWSGSRKVKCDSYADQSLIRQAKTLVLLLYMWY